MNLDDMTEIASNFLTTTTTPKKSTTANALKNLYENLNTVVVQSTASLNLNNNQISMNQTPTTTSNSTNAIYENVEALKQTYENVYSYYFNSNTNSNNNNNSGGNQHNATATTTSNINNDSLRSQMNHHQASNDDDVKVQLYFCGTILVIYIQHSIGLDYFKNTIKKLCKFDQEQAFTVKWVDEEGDPCTISNQCELDEAIRLYYLNKESELIVHIFCSVPTRPGAQCAGEDRSIYRRGARRWRKLYLVNGHKYQAKRFARTALCEVCKDRIWGLGRQGYKCLDCKIMVHKRCHKFISLQCNEILEESHKISSASSSTQVLNSTALTAPSSHNSSSVSEPLIVPTKRASTKISASSQQQPIIDELKKSIKQKAYADEHVDHEVSKQVGVKVDASNVDTKKMSLDRFDLIKVIGRGSYAKVFLVEYKPNRKVYAMKVIKKTTVNDDEDIDWVQTEKHVFEQATNHPFLVGLHSCFQTESRLFFIIEYLCGGDLMYHMQQKRKLPEDHARFYSAEIIIALDFLHSKGIIYRDLKLDNVLLDMDGHVKLTDYGMCKEGILRGEKTSTFCGTPNYIAPEMLRGESYSFSVDWWALGVLMYEMMAGRSPFEPVNENPSENPDLHTEDHLFQVILEKPIRIPRNLSVRAASVLKAFLQKSPEDRLGTYDGLNEIKQHQFFKALDWNALEQKQIQPPYKPPVQNERDLNNIDKLFTNEPVILTPDSPNTLARIQQNEFEGFEYINPLIWSEEFDL